jgi:hypothetical protein
MKTFSILLFSALIFTYCCSAKQSSKTIYMETPFDETLAIEDKVTVSKGTLLRTTLPVKELPVVQETAEIVAPVVVVIQPKISNTTSPVDEAVVEGKAIVDLRLEQTELHKLFDTLLKNNVSSTGNVNYAGLKSNRKALLNYIKALGENLPEDTWSQNEKLAYWMNAYNAMTIDLILRNQPLESIKDIKNPWDQRLWKLGDKYYNLDEIEHQILRKMGDARIHFGINCASFSCPPLLNEAFVPSKVDAQLNVVAKRFINDPSRNMISEHSIEISNIFKWFSKDFTRDGSVIDYLNKFSTISISEDAKVRYMDYDWGLNK